jgi:hypothetical protein
MGGLSGHESSKVVIGEEPCYAGIESIGRHVSPMFMLSYHGTQPKSHCSNQKGMKDLHRSTNPPGL